MLVWSCSGEGFRESDGAGVPAGGRGLGGLGGGAESCKGDLMSLLRFFFLIFLAVGVEAQSAAIRGVVTDESGAVIPGATIVLNGRSGPGQTSKTGADGSYSFANLPAGEYTIQASAPQLVLLEPLTISLGSTPRVVDIVLNVFAEKEQVTVEETSRPTVSTEASANANAVVLRDTDLDALSDNPDDLAADLQALAGPAAGPNGGAIFIDGFSGGQLPAKNAIREIRINQNPFSPEYDKLGFARIEVFTKPGTDRFHADLGYNFATDKWNSRNPYAEQKAPFQLHELREMVSGPLGKRASFNLNVVREWVNNGNVVNGVTLDPQTSAAAPFTDTPVSELRRTGVTPRIDYQLGANHTLSLRYAYGRDIVRNAGTGGFNLAERGFHNDLVSHTVQVTETDVLSSAVINETRFQYFRPAVVSQANVTAYSLQVLGAFNGGGNPIGRSADTQNSFEIQNNTSVLRGLHTIRFGVRFRALKENNVSMQNYAGTFTFSGGLAPELDANDQPVLNPSGEPILVNISSIENYRRAIVFQHRGLLPSEIRQLGGGASQFMVNAGNPQIYGNQIDVGAFIGDDWRVRQNLTMSLGLRYEMQTNIHDWRDFAPRVGIAWSPGAGTGRGRPRNVLRAGFGMFYDRFALANVLAAQRYNGVIQQQYLVADPDFFPSVPAVSSIPGLQQSSTIQMISSSMRAPYLMQSAFSYERELPRNTTMAVTYANSHGLHMLRSSDINAPLAGTYDAAVPGSGVYPFGRPGLVVLMESSGLYNQNQVLLNVNSKVNGRISLSGVYAYGRAMSNTDGLGTFPANPYSMQGEYGPAGIDMRHRVTVGGTVDVKWGIRFNPLLTATTGPPFDITTGQDLYGDGLFNTRPAIATDPAKPGLVQTPYGPLDPSPGSGQAMLPRNFGRGPGQIMLNMRIGRTFTFGSQERHAPMSTNPGGVSTAPGAGAAGPGRGEPASPFSMGSGTTAGGSAGRRYSLLVSMQIRNLTNHNNPGPIIGNITSPLFGQANQPAGSGNAIFAENANNRRLELQMRLTF